MTEKIFVEVGFDLDNNRFGFGRSVEIEYADGTEKRFEFTNKFFLFEDLAIQDRLDYRH